MFFKINHKKLGYVRMNDSKKHIRFVNRLVHPISSGITIDNVWFSRLRPWSAIDVSRWLI